MILRPPVVDNQFCPTIKPQELLLVALFAVKDAALLKDSTFRQFDTLSFRVLWGNSKFSRVVVVNIVQSMLKATAVKLWWF